MQQEPGGGRSGIGATLPPAPVGFIHPPIGACYPDRAGDIREYNMSGLSRRAFVSTAMALAVAGSASAQHTMASSGPRVALKGYDPVAYFTDGKPEKGSKEFIFAYDDTTYWFKSAAHRDKFAADPEHYAPQFDGYCAIQLSRGRKVEADPEAWAITKGKLYVFSAKGGMPIFHEQSVAIAAKAKENWPKLRAAP
jgi:YHS domain-containing protein